MPRKCVSQGGRKPPHRSDRYWDRRRGAWLAGHYWLDKLIGFFLGYEVRRIKFQRRRPRKGDTQKESRSLNADSWRPDTRK